MNRATATALIIAVVGPILAHIIMANVRSIEKLVR